MDDRAGDMPAGRLAGYGVDFVGDRLVAYLGLGDRDNADTWKPGDPAWHAGRDQPTTFNPGVYTSVVSDGQLYLLDFADNISGGGTTASVKVWHYDPVADTWTRAAGARVLACAQVDVAFGNVKILKSDDPLGSKATKTLTTKRTKSGSASARYGASRRATSSRSCPSAFSAIAQALQCPN